MGSRNVGTMERVRVFFGRLGYGIIVLILASMAVSAGRSGDRAAVVLSGGFALFLAYVVVVGRFEPGWEGEMREPPSGLRTAVAAAVWLCVGTLLAFPELLMPGIRVHGRSGWIAWVALVFFTLPVMAFVHLEFVSGLNRQDRAKRRWGIGRLGPIGALAYLLGEE